MYGRSIAKFVIPNVTIEVLPDVAVPHFALEGLSVLEIRISPLPSARNERDFFARPRYIQAVIRLQSNTTKRRRAGLQLSKLNFLCVERLQRISLYYARRPRLCSSFAPCKLGNKPSCKARYPAASNHINRFSTFLLINNETPMNKAT